MRSSFEPVASPRRQAAGFEPAPLPGAAARFDADRSVAEWPAAPVAASQASAVDLEALRRAAYAEGCEAGRAELPWREAGQLESALAALGAAARELAALREDYLSAQREGVLDLALAVAAHLLGRELRSDHEALAGLLARAVALLPAEGDLVVRVSPADHATLAAGDGAALARLAARPGVRVESDPGLVAGEGRIEAGAAGVDARPRALLERVREALAPLVVAELESAAAAAQEPA